MAVETTYTNLRAELARYLDRVTADREVVFVKRRGSKDVALVSADELVSLTETAHLLRSPKNARRLLQALGRVERREGDRRRVEELRAEFGLEADR